MSTRCNVVIKKSTINGNSIVTEYQQVYRHRYGYPIKTGRTLQKFVHEQFVGDLFMQQSPKDFAIKLNEYDSEFEIEKRICLHGDILYLYVIDLNKKDIRCYSVDWSEMTDIGEELDVINNDLDVINNDYFLHNNTYTLVYSLGFDVDKLALSIKKKELNKTSIGQLASTAISNIENATIAAINILHEFVTTNQCFIDLTEISTHGFPETEFITEDDCGELVIDYIVGLRSDYNYVYVLFESSLEDDENVKDIKKDDERWLRINCMERLEDVVKTILYFLVQKAGNYNC